MIQRTNFRDCQAWKDERLTLSTQSNECCKLYDAALTQYVGWYDDDNFGGLDKTLEALVATDPKFVLGKALCIGLELLGTSSTTRLNPSLAADLECLVDMANSQQDVLTWREKKHVEAVQFFANGFMSKAVNTMEEILINHPTDMHAIKFAHDCYFYLGKQMEMRDSIARVMPSWNTKTPLYSYLFGMYSFGLVETNIFDEAKTVAEKGLEMNRHDAWSTHSLAHVYEMQAEFKSGIGFMSKTVQNWEPCGMLACHNFWHWAIYHIERNEHEAAFDLYDYRIGKIAKASQGALLDIVDAASLLYRLQFEGRDPGKDRWNALLDLTIPHFNEHVLLYNDAHLLMSYLGANDKNTTNKFMSSLREHAKTCDGDYAESINKFGINLMEGMIAYHEERYDEAVDLLNPVRYQLVHGGGSNAQRDVYNLLLLNAAINSSTDQHKNLARRLLDERKATRVKSPLTDRLIIRCRAKHQL